VPNTPAKKISSMQGWFTQQFSEGVFNKTFNPHNASAGNVKYHKALISSPSAPKLEGISPFKRSGERKTEKEQKAYENHLNQLKL
jgi:predicted fused transcriptional regulator/phosphomethylpyrimidine kinase